MKMNSLDALNDLLDRVAAGEPLAGFEPRKYGERLDGQTVAEVGTQPILHMRAFQRSGALPEALLADVRGRTAG
ncbi:MAG: hypothetical protein H6711_29440 [Myxococcales bacterium]|nr:hypothetical protein [Myxococcales bacterium]